MRQHFAHFANFICRFGADGMLSYAEEIVLPAFTNDTYVRSYGSTHYHFYDVRLLKFTGIDSGSNLDLVIAGQFVKDTKLRREQVFVRNKGVVQDEAEIDSAPSAYFVLVLKNHRLIYFPETHHAPGLGAFKVTAQKFLDKSWSSYTKQGNDVVGQVPRPTLEVVPLTSTDGVEEFVSRFEKLQRVEFRLVDPNPEIDAGEIFEQLRGLKDEMGGDTAKVTLANTRDGLDTENATEVVVAATKSGNQQVKLVGIDVNGNKLSGNNDEINLDSEISPVPVRKKTLTKKLLERFYSFVASGIIQVRRPRKVDQEKLDNLEPLFEE